MLDLMPRGHFGLFDDFDMGMARMPALFDGIGAVTKCHMDIKENEKEYVAEAELPGYSKEDISVNTDGDIISIVAKKKEDKEEKKENYLRKERYVGEVRRSFSLKNIDTENINASFENGILKLVIPKKVTNNPGKQIEIK